MRIGLALLTLFPSRVGGSETYVRGLLDQYADGAGPDEVVVLANRHVLGRYRAFERGPVRLQHVPSYRPGDGTLTRAIAMIGAAAWPSRAARDVPRDLDLLHYPVTVPIPATPVPRVVTLYDIQHHDLPQLFSPAERAFRRWAYDGSARKADLVVTTSNFSKARIVEQVGIAPERVEVVHLGVDRDGFAPKPGERDADVRREFGLPARFAFFPANLWPHKNHERLLEAMALLGDGELGLVLTGQGYGRLDSLLDRARRLGIDDRVKHLGHVPSDVLPALYRSAELLVFPSLYEGFGAPPLEAMACGCPVVASDRGSIPEVCGDAALLVDAESPESIAAAVDLALGDKAMRERLRQRGFDRSAQFTWRVAAERHQAIYSRAAAT